MTILSRLRGLFAKPPEPVIEFETVSGPQVDPALFVYVKVRGDIGPYDRGQKYADPLGAVLSAADLGMVTGGGTLLDEPYPDGSPRIEFAGVEIQVTQLEPALQLLRQHLPRLRAPVGTEIQYTRDGVRLQDELTDVGWRIGHPRTTMHPYLGC